MRQALKVLALLTLFCVAARADTIFTNFGPNQTYDCCTGYNIQNDVDGFSGVAVSFTPQADYVDSTFIIPVFTLYPGNFTVSLFSDEIGLPGAALGISSFDAENFYTQGMFTGSMGPLTADTTYWLVAMPDPDNDFMLLAWNWNTTGDNGPIAWTPDGTTWYTSIPSSKPAFEIDGTPTPVPEPGSFVLLGTGLIVLAVKRRMARRKQE